MLRIELAPARRRYKTGTISRSASAVANGTATLRTPLAWTGGTVTAAWEASLEDPKRVEKRQYQRFKLDVEIKVNSRTAGQLSGHSLEISEVGISVILVIGVPVGEVIQLEFKLANGPVKLLAFVRNRTAFRYGLEFVRPNGAEDAIKAACAVLPRVGELDG